MAVHESSIIDIVSLDQTDAVILSVVDHLDWDDEQKHLYMIQDKLNTYCRYIENAQLYDDCPAARDRRPLISLMLFNPPPLTAVDFFEAFKLAIEAEGIGFQWRLSSESLHGE